MRAAPFLLPSSTYSVLYLSWPVVSFALESGAVATAVQGSCSPEQVCWHQPNKRAKRRGAADRASAGSGAGRWTEETWAQALAEQARQKKLRQEARAHASSEPQQQKVREEARADVAAATGNKRIVIGSRSTRGKLD